MNITEISALFDTFSRAGFNLETNTAIKGFRAIAIAFIKAISRDISLGEAKWMLHNRLTSINLCSICKTKETPFRGATLGYQQTCSIKCSRQLDSYKLATFNSEVNAKRKAAVLKTFNAVGVTNPGQLEKTKMKIAQTNIQRYGVKSSLARNDVKDKIKNTNIEKYGAENVLSANSTIRKNLNEKLIDQKSNTKKLHEQKKKLRKDEIFNTYNEDLKEYEITNLQKYGTKNVWGNKTVISKIRQTNVDRYGVEHPAQNPQIRNKIVKSKIQNYVSNILPIRLKNLKLLDTYPYGWDEYSYGGGIVKFEHRKCGTIFEKKFYAGDLPKCPKCFSNRSSQEQFVCSWLDKEGIKYIMNDRKLIAPLEIDILTDKFAIEINGVYWHNDSRAKTTILEKSKKSSVPMLHFWDIEINEKPSIVKSIILAKHGVFEKSVQGRKTKVHEINTKDANMFMLEHHLQGSCVASIAYGCFYNDELISVMTFGKPRWRNDADYEILRFASRLGYKIIGGASKLLSAFIKDKHPSSIISYSDQRFSDGGVYSKLGFKYQGTSKPSHFWYKNGKTLSRFQTQKHLLEHILEEYDPCLTAINNIENNGWIKCSDCGAKLWRLDILK